MTSDRNRDPKTNRNDKNDDEDKGISVGALIGGAAAVAGGIYLMSKLFGRSSQKAQGQSSAMDDDDEDNEPDAVRANRTNQCNPNHLKTGPGRRVGYHGAGTREDLDNHANQLNPNNPKFGGGQNRW